MKHILITGDYDFDTNTIHLYTRNENGDRDQVDCENFEPYFYVPEDEIINAPFIVSREPSKILSIDEKHVDKIVVEHPRDVKDLRREFSETYEADIAFVMRYLIDNNIYYAFETDNNGEMIPIEHDQPTKFVACDIETPKKGRRYPKATEKDAMVTVCCVYDSWSQIYYSFIIDRKIKKERTQCFSPTHKVVYVMSEKRLLELFYDYIERVKPDIFTAWNVDYDKEYLDERARVKKVPLQWNKMNVFDLCQPYKNLYAKSNNDLESVVEGEKLEVKNYQPFRHEMWEADDLTEAILTNKSHVEAIVKLNEEKRLLEFFWDMKSLTGMHDLNDTMFHGRLVDTLLLRRYHGKWILPSKPSDDEKERRKAEKDKKVGGAVLAPPYGIFENVGVFDMSRYYPEMLIAQNLSPEPHGDELGVVPLLALDLIEKRLQYDAELKKLIPGSYDHEQMQYRRNSVKYITESVIGYFGSEHSRLYNLDIFNSVTMMGQRGINFLKESSKKIGEEHRVLYFDTDGASIMMNNLEQAKSRVNDFNNALKEFCKRENIKRELTLKLDRYFSIIGFKKKRERVDGKWTVRGAKKKYFGRVIYDGGKNVDYLKITGFEYVRRDSATITKRIQPKVFDMILNGEKEKVGNFLKEEVSRVRKEFNDGLLTVDDIAIPVTIGKSLDLYGKEKDGNIIGIPYFVRGALYSNKWFGTDIQAEDQVKVIYVTNVDGCEKTDVISYLSLSDIPIKFDIDIDKMIDRNIRRKVEDVIELIDVSWDKLFSKDKNLFTLGGG